MARPRSKDKHRAILDATASLIADRGLSASTAAIAKHAGVAEGTVFIYFHTKADLFNALYLHLKQEIRGSTDSEGATDLTLVERARLSWDRFINWGVENPIGFNAMKQLDVSELVTDETRDEVARMFPESHDLSYAYSESSPASSLGPDYVDALFNALVDMTISLILANPTRSREYRTAGFSILWSALGN